MSAGIYIHIPYCKQRCAYCDFYKEITEEKSRIDDFVQALIQEIDQRKSYLKEKEIATIYFGGGTPSVLDYKQFNSIFQALKNSFNIQADAEITLEANPDDLTDEYLESLTPLSFNRLSIGIQSFNNDYLKLLNRRHTAEEAKISLYNARKFGFNNISIDLIYALPGQTMNEWQSDLTQAFELHPEHISTYELSYEKGTEFWKRYQKGEIKETDTELILEMYRYLRLKMREKAYETYEISNYAKPGFRSRHNSAYWKFIPYLGLGPSAHSFDGKSRQWNLSSEKIYREKIKNNQPAYQKEILSTNDLYNDFILVSLRTSEGIDLKKLKALFGENYYDYCLQNADNHFKTKNLILDNEMLFLSEEGIQLADMIIVELMKTD